MVKYIVAEEDNIEEEVEVEEHLVHVSDEDVEEVQGDVCDNVLDEDDIDDVLDEELEEVELDIGEHVPDDDMDDDDMIGIDNIDDDYDMANPFNVNFEPNDTDDELDEEED